MFSVTLGSRALHLSPLDSIKGPWRSPRRLKVLIVNQQRPPPRRRRFARVLLNTPRRLERYLEESPMRRWSWRFLAFSIGFLCGNTVSLTFGTLAVNDVVAAVVTLIFYYTISRLYWSHPNPPYILELLNLFKNGVIAGLIADAFKLGG